MNVFLEPLCHKTPQVETIIAPKCFDLKLLYLFQIMAILAQVNLNPIPYGIFIPTILKTIIL